MKHEWKHKGVTSPEARKEIREYIDKCIKEAIAESNSNSREDNGETL